MTRLFVLMIIPFIMRGFDATEIMLLDVNEKSKEVVKTVNLNVKEGQTVTYGNSTYGFWEKRVENADSIDFIPPGYKVPIEFYLKKGKVFLKKQSFRSPFDSIESLFNHKVEGKLSQPFFATAVFMLKDARSTTKLNFNKNIFSQDHFKIRKNFGWYTLNLVFNRIGEVVYKFDAPGFLSDVRNGNFLFTPMNLFLNHEPVVVTDFQGKVIYSKDVPFVSRGCQFGRTISESFCISKDERFVKKDLISKPHVVESSRILKINFKNSSYKRVWSYMDLEPISRLKNAPRKDYSHENMLRLYGNKILITSRNAGTVRLFNMDTNKYEWILGPYINENLSLRIPHSGKLLVDGSVLLNNNGEKLSSIFKINPKTRDIEFEYFPTEPIHSPTHGNVTVLNNGNYFVYMHNHSSFQNFYRNYFSEINPITKKRNFHMSLSKRDFVKFGVDFTMEDLFALNSLDSNYLGESLNK